RISISTRLVEVSVSCCLKKLKSGRKLSCMQLGYIDFWRAGLEHSLVVMDLYLPPRTRKGFRYALFDLTIHRRKCQRFQNRPLKSLIHSQDCIPLLGIANLLQFTDYFCE